MNLQTLANIAEIFGALLVVTGVFFGLIEVRHYRQQRQEAASMEIMRAFQSHEFTKALRLVMSYEQECQRCSEESIPIELQDAAMLVSTTMEAIGLMVFQRIVTFRLVQHLMGGTIQASWRVLRPHTQWMREKLRRPSGGNDGRSVRLFEVAGELGEKLVLGDSHRYGQPTRFSEHGSF